MATTTGPATRDLAHAGDTGVVNELRPVFDAIDESRGMLEWPDNWDGEGSSAYAGATWERGAAFVRDNALRLWEDEGKLIEAPDIQPGALGRIVLEWSVGNRELIVVIPVDTEEQAEFYGHDGERTVTIKGKLDTASPQSSWLLMWTVR